MSEEVTIDINQADAETLATLTGIGPTRAQRIVEYRENVHPFEEVIELTAVPGISERMVRQFEDRITVAATVPPDAQLVDVAEEETAVIPAETPIEDEPAIVPAEEDEIVPVAETADRSAQALVEPDIAAIAPEPDMGGEEGAAETERVEETTEAQAWRRGCFSAILGAAAGAILGAVLTLVVLAALNRGTLTFSDTDAQLRRDLNEALQVQNDLATELDLLGGEVGDNINDVNERIDAAATQQAQADEAILGLDDAIQDLDDEMAQTDDEIRALNATDDALDERIGEVAAAADTFNDFLNGLRDLLIDVQGLPAPTATITATTTVTGTIAPTSPTPTPAATGDATDEADEPGTPTPTTLPTRTPRPTATPITLPTSPPSQQP